MLCLTVGNNDITGKGFPVDPTHLLGIRKKLGVYQILPNHVNMPNYVSFTWRWENSVAIRQKLIKSYLSLYTLAAGIIAHYSHNICKK